MIYWEPKISLIIEENKLIVETTNDNGSKNSFSKKVDFLLWNRNLFAKVVHVGVAFHICIHFAYVVILIVSYIGLNGLMPNKY